MIEFLFILMMTLLCVVAPFYIPTRRWSFDYGGHTIKIINYTAHEVVYIDGVKQPQTRTSPVFQLSHAEHRVVMPNGEILDVCIEAHGLTVVCQAFHNDLLVYDSADRTHNRRLKRRSPSGLQKREDPRWPAAQQLLTELTNSDREEVVMASQKLSLSLRTRFTELEKLHSSIEAYKNLGQSNDEEMEAHLAQGEERVQMLLRLLQELHFNNTSNQDQAPPPEIIDVIMQLKAEREVESRLKSKKEKNRRQQKDL